MSRPGELAEPGDAEIDPILSEILQAYRSRTLRKINRADVRESLRVLARMEPDEARKCWRKLDAATKAAINGEHHQHGEAPIYARGLDYHQHGPVNISELAKLAIKVLPGESGGHPPSFWEEHLAASLAVFWWKTHGTQPTIQVNASDYGPTPFQEWAEKMFIRVKRHPDSRTLQAGIRQARQDGRIPHK
jgi:hypothetical protein